MGDDLAGGRPDEEASGLGEEPSGSNARTLGRLKSGKARADKLSHAKRKAIAKNAAAARWNK